MDLFLCNWMHQNGADRGACDPVLVDPGVLLQAFSKSFFFNLNPIQDNLNKEILTNIILILVFFINVSHHERENSFNTPKTPSVVQAYPTYAKRHQPTDNGLISHTYTSFCFTKNSFLPFP